MSYAYRASPYSNMVSVMFTIDLPWSQGTRQDREHAAKLREEDAARAMQEDTQRMRAAEVQSMQAEWESARAQAQRIETELIPLAVQRREAALAAYRGGTGTLAAVLEARRALLDAELAPHLSSSRPPPRRGPGSISSFRHGGIMRSINVTQRGAKLAPLAAAVAIAVIAAGAGYFFGTRQAPVERTRGAWRRRRNPPRRSPPPMRAARKVLYWHDPMVPGQKFDKPGKSPFMDMDLVPVYADAAADGGVAISARQQQSFGVRTAAATEGTLDTGFSAVGAVVRRRALARRGADAQPPATSSAFSCARSTTASPPGSRWPSSTCRNGSPRRRNCWRSRPARRPDVAKLADAARHRLSLLGMPDAEIARIERDGKAVAAHHGDGAAGRRRLGDRRARRDGGHAGHDAVQDRRDSAPCG